MSGTRQSLRRRGAAGLAIVLITAFGVISSSVLADDVGVTLQTTLSDAYKGTVPLPAGTVGLLKGGAEDSNDPAKIRATLRKLRDGDVLVLATHSNPEIFAIGGRTPNWTDFWKTFGIEKPPRLAAVIIGGCMVQHIGNDEIQKITIPQVNGLRAIFNAEILYAPKGAIHVVTARKNTFELLTSLLADKKLNDFKLGEQWYQSVSYRWTIQNRWKTVSLNNLRRVNAASRAYEAGVAARLRKQQAGDAGKAFDQDPAMKQAFLLGYEHADVGPDTQRAEYDKVRKMIEEGQQLQ